MSQRTAIGSGATNNNGGVAYGIGASPSGGLTNLSVATSSVTGAQILNSTGYPTQHNGLSSAFKSTAVALTSVADNGSDKCRFTKTSHGLAVGAVLFVSGSTTGNVDATHTITAVPTSDTFDTDVDYVASATAGSYTQVARNFGTMTIGEYLIKLASNKIAGTTDNTLKSPAGYSGSVRALRYARGDYILDITSWDAESGAATYGSSAGTKVTYRDASGNALAHEALPTNAIPGGLVYAYGASLPKDDQYKARTSP